MLGAVWGLFLVLLFFSSRSNFDDNYQHEMSSTLWGPAGSCLSYFKRLRQAFFSFSLHGHRRGVENSWEQTGHTWAWNHPSVACFSLLQLQTGCTSKQGASAEHLGWQIKTVVLEELILKTSFMTTSSHCALPLSILWPKYVWMWAWSLVTYQQGIPNSIRKDMV